MVNPNIRILVVDDFKSMRRIIRNQLSSIGLTNIEEADDGDVAMKILQKQDFDLILSDWNMPRMTGFDLLKFVKGDERLKNTPFIMITAEGQQDNIVLAIQAKVNQYIVKPFTPETLQKKINNVFE